MLRALACALLLLPLAALLPGSAAGQGMATACGVDLASGTAPTPGGIVCGTDEGDDLDWSGEDSALTFFGENGHDTVDGSREPDTIQGGPGNDELHGGRGGDRIDGGDDSDFIYGGLGDDVIVERRFGVREAFYGGPGDDVLAGGRGSDTLYGGTGNDVLVGGSGSDVLWGGPGDDVLYGGPNRDTFRCGPGNDVVHRVRVSGSSRSSTERRDSFIRKADGCERIVDSDPTADFPLRDVLGTNGPDQLVGGGGRELLQGKGGADRVFAGGGDDELEGDGAFAQGGDLLMGGSGNDRIAGRAGNDRLYGDARSSAAGPPGNDELVGGAGRDLMNGGPGDDLLVGAYDGDTIFGGAGHDVVTLLGGDTSDAGGRVLVDCGPGFDVAVLNPERRGDFRNCERFVPQFHEADFGRLFRPSPEAIPPGLALRATVGVRAARAGARRAQAPAPPAAAEADGGASAPSISADGTRIAFSSDASNLVVGDSNGERTDPFVRVLPDAATLLVDQRRRGGGPAGQGGRLRRGPSGAISANGRWVAFSSRSTELAGSVGHYTIFRRDLYRRTTQVACRAGNEDSESPALSADGAHVAFESRATNLAGGDRNRQTDVYWCDLNTGELRRVSAPIKDTVDDSGSSFQPSISQDGRYVAFVSDSGGLVAGDGARSGVYWRDMQTGETRVVDVRAGASTSDGSGMNPRISADGRFVAFDSDATDLPGGELNGRAIDVFRKDMADGSVVLVSRAADGSGAAGGSTTDSITGDGSGVVFTSSAPNLVAGDGNGRADVFVRSVPSATTFRVSARADGSELAGPSSSGAVSAGGSHVAFASRAPDVTPGTGRSERARVYRKDLTTGAVDLVTVGLDLPPRSLIAKPAGVLLRRKARLIAGTVTDNGAVQRVDVSLSRSIGSGRCLALTRGRRFVRVRCGRPVWLRARVTNGLRFTARIGRLLPRGNWTLRSRATDDAGQVDAAEPGRNSVQFRVR